jgi:uncharacterized membrane protein YfhO
VAENFYPGWTARVDGREAPVARVDFTLLGVPLPAGARSVELAFTSPRYERGRTLTIVVLLLASALVVAGLAVDRRTRMTRGA